MKRIKCLNCGMAWYVEDNFIKDIKVCTFCDNPVTSYEDEVPDNNSIVGLLCNIAKKQGTDILSSSRLFAYMSDLAPQLEKEIRIFSRSFNDEYLNMLQNAFVSDSDDAIHDLNKIKICLMDEAMSEEWADKIVESCKEAARAYKGGKRRVVSNILIDTYKETNLLESRGADYVNNITYISKDCGGGYPHNNTDYDMTKESQNNDDIAQYRKRMRNAFYRNWVLAMSKNSKSTGALTDKRLLELLHKNKIDIQFPFISVDIVREDMDRSYREYFAERMSEDVWYKYIIKRFVNHEAVMGYLNDKQLLELIHSEGVANRYPGISIKEVRDDMQELKNRSR